MAKEGKVMHMKCCVHNKKYVPDKIRSKPFKWINFPIFIAIWFVLFWFITCPIVWSKAEDYYSQQNPKTWPKDWMKYFWLVAFLVFTIILGLLLLIWKCYSSKEGNRDYDQVFLNPQSGDEKEFLCKDCNSFHPQGGKKCSCSSKDVCEKCGNKKESFGLCCQQDKTVKGNSSVLPYDITIRKQQPDANNTEETRTSDNMMKRNSLRSVGRGKGSNTSSIIISAHEVCSRDPRKFKPDDLQITGIKIIKNIEHTKDNVNVNELEKPRPKKKPNLPPVDVELANRRNDVEFFGEKILLNNKAENKTEDNNTAEPKTVSISSLDSMNKDNFNRFLHLVEINTPITPPETIFGSEKPIGSPMSPREIFFRDLLIAADNSENGNSPDSTHFGSQNYKLEKKRPTSHILVASDVSFEDEKKNSKPQLSKRHTCNNIELNLKMPRQKQQEDLESPKIQALTEAIKFHTSEVEDGEDRIILRDDIHGAVKKTTVQIIRTSRSSSVSPKVLTPSEQADMNKFMKLKSSTNNPPSSRPDPPPKPLRQSVSDASETSKKSPNKRGIGKDRICDNDDVFTN